MSTTLKLENEEAAISQVPVQCVCSADLRICERAGVCDGMDSDGELCRHAKPHKRDSGCEVGCTTKHPFGAVCICVPNATTLRLRGDNHD